ncbi:hypothetical protein ABRP72_14220 [Pectobacterium carotovorum]|uniref:hypothetical protein n=1 Tax=Pectobacterium carotovorum TaxID=554 RepID=UPI0032EBA3CA
MTINFPSNNFSTLAELDIDTRNQVIAMNSALIATLSSSHLTQIKNSFTRAVLVWQNGMFYIKITELNNLLRTGNSGVDNYLWQHGMQGYTSPSTSYTINNQIYISGSDFCALLDARIQTSFARVNLYLRYVRALYQELSSQSIISDLRTAFHMQINQSRNNLKSARIREKGITHCEFTNTIITDFNQVQFAHIDSVATAPLKALNIENGVIIFTRIHQSLTDQHIHDFEGMYDFCVTNNYSTIWADNYPL